MRVKFIHDEDILIARMFNRHGTDWKSISKFFPHRTDIMLKNRFYAYIRKNNLVGKLIEDGQNIADDALIDRIKASIVRDSAQYRSAAL